MGKPQHYTRGHKLVIGFTGLYLLGAAVGAGVSGNGEFIFYLVVMLVLVAAVAGIDRRVRFSVGLLWCLTAWGAMHMAGGLVPVPESWPINGDQRVLYSWWVVPFVYGSDGTVSYGLKYDQVTHLYGFGVTCWACWEGLCATIRSAWCADRETEAAESEQDRRAQRQAVSPTAGRLTLCFAGAMGFGAMNEVIEFIATMFGPTNVGGYENTGYDLIFNAVGAAAAVLVIRVVSAR